MRGPRGIVAAARRILTDDKLQFSVAGLVAIQGVRYVFEVLAADRRDNQSRLEEIEGTLEHFRGRIGTLEGRQMAASAAVRAQRAHHPSVGIPEPHASAEAPKPAP